MLGLELVTDAASRTPAPALARRVKRHCKEAHRVLLSTEGPFSSVIKVKPPLCFSEEQAERMVGALRNALRTLSADERAELAEASREEVACIAERHRLLA
jgi:ethanolamine-phosphate phospho-lyase